MTSPGHGIDISPSSPSPFSCPIIVPRHALVGEASPGKAASDAELRSETPRLIPPGKQTPPSASPARSNRPPRGRRPRFISRRRTASESTSFTSGLAAIASTTGSHEMAPRSPTHTFVNMAAVIGEDVAIDCPLRDAIAWLKGKTRLRAGVRDGVGWSICRSVYR